METVLDALDRAAADDEAGQRRRVLYQYFSAGSRQTVVGPLGVQRLGGVSSASFTTFRLAGGHRRYLSGP